MSRWLDTFRKADLDIYARNISAISANSPVSAPNGTNGTNGPGIETEKEITPKKPPPASSAPRRTVHSAYSADSGNSTWDAQDWRDFFEERAAIRQYDGHYSQADAERLAFHECVCRWHLINGKAPDTRYCAGCGNVTDNRPTMQLPDGAVVHDDPEHDCLRAYGDKWRGTAEAALAEIGIKKTESSPPYIGDT